MEFLNNLNPQNFYQEILLNTIKMLSCFLNFSTSIAKFSTPAIGFSEILKFVDVSVIDNSECADYYGSVINDSKTSVDTNGGSEGTCNGDSGGPLVITESDGQATEVGIVSFGSSAGCESGAPAAFTRVTEYLDWLETNAGVTIRP